MNTTFEAGLTIVSAVDKDMRNRIFQSLANQMMESLVACSFIQSVNSQILAIADQPASSKAKAPSRPVTVVGLTFDLLQLTAMHEDKKLTKSGNVTDVLLLSSAKDK